MTYSFYQAVYQVTAQTAALGLLPFLSLLAIFSLNIGIFNPRLNIVYTLDMSEVPKETMRWIEVWVIGYKESECIAWTVVEHNLCSKN